MIEAYWRPVRALIGHTWVSGRDAGSRPSHNVGLPQNGYPGPATARLATTEKTQLFLTPFRRIAPMAVEFLKIPST